MRWELGWGKQLAFLREIEATTGRTPKALRDRPVLPGSQRHLLDAFYELSAGRGVAEVPQPISVSDILAYAQLMGIDHQTDREWLFTCVRRLDAVYIEVSLKDR